MNAGEIADSLVELVKEECESLDDDGRRIVANRIYELISQWRPGESKSVKDFAVSPMTDAEAKLFGRQLCPFQAHRGEAWDDVDLGYVEWIADASLKTARKLSGYLRSRRVRSELSDVDN
jgi:hypothetical protein